MKRLIIIVSALLTLAGVSAVTATASLASVCKPDGTGCTKAGTYTGPNTVISKDYTGFKVVWTKSVVQPYSSGVPLYWTTYMTYTNIDSSTLTLGCPGNWADASYVSEHMSGGSGDDGTVSAESTTCSQNPGLAVPVAPGGTYTLSATFHNVPWPGSAVAITWGGAGTSPSVYPFKSSQPSSPGGISQPNWAAYSWHPQKGYVTYAGALWKVPKVNCSNAPTLADGAHARAAVWVGMWGGPNTQSGIQAAWLPQVGTISHCQINENVTPAYIAFAQMFHGTGCNVPDDNSCKAQTLSINVNYNDSIDAEVEYNFTGTGVHAGEYKFNYFLYDITTGAQVTGSLYTAVAVPMVNVAYQGGAAVEDEDDSGALAQFTTPITFSKVAVGNSSGALINPQLYRWDMVVSGKQLATVGSFSADSFTVTWKNWD